MLGTATKRVRSGTAFVGEEVENHSVHEVVLLELEQVIRTCNKP
jgi:hypothetical protein